MPFSLRDNAGSSITDTGTITNPISGTPTLNGGMSLITGYNLLTVSLGQGITLTTAGQYRSPFTITQTGTIQTAGATAVYSALASASLLNDGLLAANSYGVSLTAAGSVVNAGTIAGLADRGVFINNGGAVQNEGTNSVIYGGQLGVADQSGNLYVSNQGSIIGAGFDGVLLGQGGAVTNTGLISGLVFGVEVFPNDGYTGSINNQGSIDGAQGAGVYFFSGGPEYGNVVSNSGTIMAGAKGPAGVGAANTAITVVNQGLISGPVGIDLKSGGSVTNSGTIAGTQYAVILGGNTTNQLVIDPSAVFIGTVAAATDASNLLELGAGAGTVSGLGTSFMGFQTIAFDPGAVWTLAGDVAGLNGDTITGFTAKDTLDVSDLAVGVPVELELNSGVLSETLGGVTLNLTFAGAAPDALYQIIPDGNGGTDITQLTAANTLSVSLAEGITLTSAGQFRSPFTITQTGAAENASGTGVYSALNGAYLANAGQVTGSTYGALFHASGTIINQGTIAGLADDGVLINNGGAVQNEGTNSVIYGGQTGVADLTFHGKFYVSNQGSIIGAGFDGVLLGEGGAVTNTGLISGLAFGVDVVPNTSYAGSINNQGSIYGAYAGVYFARFGAGSGNAVTNGGTIMAGAAGQAGVLAPEQLTVDNQGLISGPVGIDLKSGGSVANSGTIAGTQYAVMLAEGGAFFGAQGNVTNTGLISGHVYGVAVYPTPSYAGSINNLGSIYGAQGAGVYFFRFGAGSGNAVTNGGTIMAGAAGQEGVGGVNPAITVVNQGLISGPVGIDLKSGGSVTNSGTIAGTQYAVILGGNTTNQLVIDPSAVFIGTVAAATDASNLLELGAGAGTVSGLGTSFMGFQTIAFDPGAVWTLAGDVAGFNGDTITGFTAKDTLDVSDLAVGVPVGLELNNGVLSETLGGVTLNLTFAGAAPDALYQLIPDGNGGADITRLISSDTLSVGLDQGITLTAAGQYRSPFTITQTGTIQTAGATAVYSALASASLLNDGLLAANNYGVSLTAAGSVVNAGSIAGLADRGVFINKGGAVQNEGTNSVIYGGQVGVADQSGNLYVSNHGSIIGAGFDGVLLGEGGAVTNTGLISGHVYGVEVFPNDGYTGSINNQGSIYGAHGAGVYFLSGGAGSGNAVTNGGTIMAGAAGQEGVGGVNLAITVVNQGLISGPVGIDLKSGGSVANSGTIAGTQYAVLLGGNTTNQLVIDPSAVFIGTVAAATDASNLLELGAGAGTVSGLGTSFMGFQTIAFDPGAVWTLAGDVAGFNGDTITGFTAKDTLDVSDLAVGVPVGLELNNGVLSETLGGVTLNLTFAGAAPAALYQLIPDGNGGTDITQLTAANTLSVSLAEGITLTSAGQFRSPFTITQTGAAENAFGTGVYSALNGAYLANTGQVTGSTYGALFHASGTIINQGTIAGLADRGVFINKGGAVQNEGTNSVIYGGQVGVADQSGNLYVSNHGSIIGAGFDGVLLGEGGAVTNTGLISGHVYGVEVFPNTSYAGSINNLGSIYGAHGAGVYFLSGGAGSGNAVTNGGTIMAGAAGQEGVGGVNLAITVVNQGLISGPVGIDLKSGGSVANSGTIAGTQYAVILGGNTTNQLVINPSAVFIGTVAAATDASNLLELGAGAGTVSGLGTSFMGFQTIAFDPGAVWTLAGDVAGFNGDTITGFTAKDTLDVSDLAVGVPVGLELNNGVLSETLGGVTLNLTFAGAAPDALYQIIPDGNGGTDITQLTAANTLSVSLAEGITLTSAGQFRSPFTITQTGTIATAGGSGVTSALAGAYLLNSGLVSASGDGVSFTGVGTVVNSASIFASGSSDGVFMLAGGSVLNQSAAVISGGFAGIGMYGTSGSVVNYGTVQGGHGITILENAYVQNSGTAALISGRDAGVSVVGGNGTVTNSGAVIATSSYGTGLFMLSGSLNNSGLISGGNFGTDIADGTGAVVNTGTITASSTAGIGLFVLGGSIQNSALIAGCQYGVESPFGTATISNTGTIIATVNAGALLIGGVVLNQSTTSLIEGGANGVQFSGATGTITNNGTISGTEDGIRFAGNGTVTNAGTISGGAYALSFSGSSASRLVVDPNAVFIGAVEAGASASNTLELAAGNGKFGGIGSTVSGFSTVAFDPGAAWTLSGSAAGFNGDTINGFTAADSLDIAGLALATPALLTLGTGGTLALEQAGGGTLGLLFADLSAGKGFTITSDGVGGDFIQETACYAAGTRILTADGRLVAVEDLREADTLETFDGQAKTVIWLGRRTMDLRQHPRPRTVQPILIMAGALGCGLPWRDLVVSPDHGMYLAGNLIPAKALTNGFTIRQLNRPRVTYYHIELAEHAVIFAEGAAAESYLATGNRGAFENGGQALTLHPDFAQSLRETQGCAPFLENGPSVEAVRQRILNHAKIATTDDPALHIRYENGAAIIESSTAVPGELTADPRDQRRLGVKIGSICSGWKTIPLDHPSLTDGWHDLETDGRWTNGHAVIPQDLLGASGSIEITLAGSLTYPQARPRTDKQFIHPAIKSAPGVQKPRRYISAA